MPAYTRYSLTGPLRIEQGEAPGTFGLVNRDATATITVYFQSVTGEEDTAILANNGDSINFDLTKIRAVTVTADAYPASILYLATNQDIVLSAAPVVTVAQPQLAHHHDLTSSTTALAAIWTPATGSRAVITGVFVSTDTAGRVAVVDGTDVAGARILSAYLPTNGSAGRAFALGPFVSGAVNRVISLVYAGGGVAFVAVDGWEQVG
jgi:hypothetical protein